MAELVQLDIFETFENEPLTVIISESVTLLDIKARGVSLHLNKISIPGSLGQALLTEFGLVGSPDGAYGANPNILKKVEITKNRDTFAVVKIEGIELTKDLKVDEIPGEMLGDAFGLQFLTVNIKKLFPESHLQYPLNKKLLEVFQYVVEVWGEDKLQSTLRFYDTRSNPDLDKLLVQFGVKDMVYELEDNPVAFNASMRGIISVIDSFFQIKGTMKAVWYCLYKGGAPVNQVGETPVTGLVEWYEPAFLPLKDGDVLNDLRGCADVHLYQDSLDVSIVSIISKFNALHPYLLPWFFHIYRWILNSSFTDTADLSGSSDTFRLYKKCGEFLYDSVYKYGDPVTYSSSACPPIAYDDEYAYDDEVAYTGAVTTAEELVLTI